MWVASRLFHPAWPVASSPVLSLALALNLLTRHPPPETQPQPCRTCPTLPPASAFQPGCFFSAGSRFSQWCRRCPHHSGPKLGPHNRCPRLILSLGKSPGLLYLTTVPPSARAPGLLCHRPALVQAAVVCCPSDGEKPVSHGPRRLALRRSGRGPALGCEVRRHGCRPCARPLPLFRVTWQKLLNPPGPQLSIRKSRSATEFRAPQASGGCED